MSWQPIETAPKDGTHIRVGHSLDPSSLKTRSMYETTGHFEAGEWAVPSFFVCIDGLLRMTPDCWLPTPTEQDEGIEG